MGPRHYTEDFNDGPGGWMRVVDNYQPPARLLVRDSVAWSYGPWWVDYNHAPPGGGYLQLLMCLNTRGPLGETITEVAGPNRFIADRFPSDFTNAQITIGMLGELEPAGANVCLLVQGSHGGKCAGWVLHSQPIAVSTDPTTTTLRAVPDERQWTCLKARHDRGDMYGYVPLETVLRDVNVNIYLILFPVHPRPMGPINGDPHILRAGRDYPIWPSSIRQGYVGVDRIDIEFA